MEPEINMLRVLSDNITSRCQYYNDATQILSGLQTKQASFHDITQKLVHKML